MNGVIEEIFKRYDVRGLYPGQLNDGIAYRAGRAFVQRFKPKTLAVGRDCRLGSEPLSKAFIKGAIGQGADITDIGLVSTDMIYFAVGKYGFDAGCMVTASHNPREWAGFKFCGKGATGISSENGLWDVRDLVASGKFEKPVKKGKLLQMDVLSDYTEKCLSLVDAKKIKPLKVVVDASNGMAAKTLSAIEARLPVKIVKVFFEVDGNFPGHEPNPLNPENVEALKKRVLEEKADLGAIFDGDGDRMLMVDEKGNPVNGSMLTCLIASSLLKKSPGSKILYTPVMSKAVPETIGENGGIPVLERVGHSFIKQRMRKENVLFGGEHSGHFYFRENYFADSGLIAWLVALEAISESGKKFSFLINPFRKYCAIDETNSDVRGKSAKLAEIEKIYAPKAEKTSKLDGFSAYFKGWWFNVRPSGTEDKLRLNLEADSRELMEAKKGELLKTIRA